MDLTDQQRRRFEQAGRELQLDYLDAGLNGPLEEINARGDIEWLDQIARDLGFEDGMPYGYSDPPHPAWRAVFDGIRDAWDEHQAASS